jgi:hypothetical protein
MTKQEFLDEINKVLKNKPSEWRRGQTVFNHIDKKYGVARIAQFKYGVDCFYMDDKIPDFLDVCYKLIQAKETQDN